MATKGTSSLLLGALLLATLLLCFCGNPVHAGFFKSLGSRVKSVATKAKSVVSKQIQASPAGRAINKIRGTKLVQGLKKFEGAVKAKSSAIAKKAINKVRGGKLAQGLKKFGNSVKAKSSAIAKKVRGGKLAQGLKKFGGSVKAKAKAIGQKAKALEKRAKAFVKKAKAEAKAIVKKAKAKVKAKAKKVVDKLKKTLKGIKTKLGKIKLGTAAKSIKKAFDKLKNKIKATVKAIKTKDKSLATYKVGSLNGKSANTKIVGGVTAGAIKVASIFSEDAYKPQTIDSLTKQGYELVLSNDHKKEMIANKVYYNPKDKTLVVTYRGTVQTSLKDWSNNLKITQKAAYFDGKYAGKVNSGYLEQYNTDRASVKAIIDKYTKEGLVSNIIFTGHSKGAALTQLAAEDYKLNNPNGAKVQLVTFGSPRVGDEEHAKIVNANIPDYTRVVNKYGKSGSDMITGLPPKWLGYSHAGNEVQLSCGSNNGISCHRISSYQENAK